ncbi:MAG: hypothetical protein U0R19_06500 [Bryobacteraceae bacterium]
MLTPLFLLILSAPAQDFTIKLEKVRSGYDGETCWVHARAGIVPAKTGPSVVLTMQKLLLTGSDVFYALSEMRTDDFGRTWNGPVEHTETLGRRNEPNGVIVAASDFWPTWHAASHKLLGIGHTVRYLNNKVMEGAPRQTTYSVYDAHHRTWTPWATVDMPDAARFYNAGAGCAQRVDLPNGDLLIPIYHHAKGEKFAKTSVMRCRFDGRRLRVVEVGNELAVNEKRGLAEPSLTKFRDRFYLTVRHDDRGYVSSSRDGLRFEPLRPWLWDDGTDLGNYNTQQHWVSHPKGLYLVYTRKGANNDHVFRHRAPLFIAKVDPTTLRVIRSTEQVLVPQRGARLGNFGVTDISGEETWVTVTEWMQTWGPNIVMKPDNPYGADNTLWIARILWNL